MSAVAVQPFTGTYRTEPVHSSFAFSVRYAGLSRYRGTLADVVATLRADGTATTLEGSAAVDSISIVEPAVFREHVLGAEFFDAENHPELTFRSTAIRLADDGRAEVDGMLTIRGVTRPVAATGHYAAPRPGALGGEVAGLQLAASLDRRDFGFDWQLELPDGGEALGWDVELSIELVLERDDPEATPPRAGEEA